EQGLIAEASAGTYVRMDFYSDGNGTRLFAATATGGSTTARSNISLGSVAAPMYLRMRREGDLWTESYSLDGIHWTVAATFTHALTVERVGVFAGNAPNGGPGHAAVVDYLFNTAEP